jgi:hypothetical protein
VMTNQELDRVSGFAGQPEPGQHRLGQPKTSPRRARRPATCPRRDTAARASAIRAPGARSGSSRTVPGWRSLACHSDSRTADCQPRVLVNGVLVVEVANRPCRESFRTPERSRFSRPHSIISPSRAARPGAGYNNARTC